MEGLVARPQDDQPVVLLESRCVIQGDNLRLDPEFVQVETKDKSRTETEGA